jgi:hypothetical protein
VASWVMAMARAKSRNRLFCVNGGGAGGYETRFQDV